MSAWGLRRRYPGPTGKAERPDFRVPPPVKFGSSAAPPWRRQRGSRVPQARDPRWRSRTVRPTDAPAHCIGLRTPVRLTSKNDTPHTPPGCPAPPSGEGGITGRRPSPECGTVLGRAGPAGLGWPFTRQVVFVISSANSLPWFLVCVFGVAAVGFDWPLPAGQLVLEHPYLGREAGKLPATGCFGCFRPSIGCGGHTFHEPGG